MRTFLTTLLFIVLTGYVFAEEIIPVDKAAHFGLSAAGTMGCEVVVRRVFNTSKLVSTTSCAVAMLSVGVAKEAYDSKNGGDPSIKDFYADALGVGFGVAIIAIDW